jgi:hypothetical protein
MFTKNSVDDQFGDDELTLLANCEKALAKEQIISIDCSVGNPKNGTVARLIVPAKFAHVAYGGKNLFVPVGKLFKALKGPAIEAVTNALAPVAKSIIQRLKGFGIDVVPGIGLTIGNTLFSISVPIYNVNHKATPTFGAWVYYSIKGK